MALLAPPVDAENYLDVLQFNQSTDKKTIFFKTILQRADHALVSDFYDHKEITRLVRARAWYVEQIILQLWKTHITCTRSALVAVGGFGRGELHPHSDVDLLILVPKNHRETKTRLSLFIQSLWDIGLDVGHSVRTVKQCYKKAKKNVTITTSLMEARHICGHKKRFNRMTTMITAKRIWKGQAFFAAKSQEQKLRHKRFSDTTYNLEPNIKEGPGGLRDIQMISWVAQRFFATTSLHELVDAGFLTEHEYINLIKGQNFLWSVRFALHIIAKRKEDRIAFDHQLKLADIFGYLDVGKKNPAVEQFMQAFYRNAMRLERLNLRLLQLFDENILKEKHQNAITNINPRFHIVNDFLEIKDTTLFHSCSEVWFELFLLLQKYPEIQGVRADTVRAMRHNLNHINTDDFRNNNAVKQQFLQILQQNAKVASVFNQMNQLGILARYLPAFGRIVGRMQFDLFHIYTVDQHSLFVLRNLCLLRHGKTQVTQAESIFAEIPHPYLVYIAAIFHDIAKGREGDHSELGAIDAEQFCENHGITDDDQQLVVWLVKDHLIMSETAQKRDLSDPQTIQHFAQSVQSPLRLKALYLLTIADISATDPKLWNGFKASLLRELFVKTIRHFSTEQNEASLINVKKGLNQHLRDQNIHTAAIESKLHNFPEKFLRRMPQQKLHDILTLVINKPAPIITCLKNHEARKTDNHQVVEFFIYCADFKGLFYMTAAILEKYHFNIVDANINVTNDHFALNTIKCMTTQATKTEVINELTDCVAEQKIRDISINKYTPQRERAFTIQPQIKILESHSNEQSLIEVICRDSHGLLARISKVLYLLGISINAAKIVNVGTRAEDTFWLSQNKQALNTEHLALIQKKLLEIL